MKKSTKFWNLLKIHWGAVQDDLWIFANIIAKKDVCKVTGIVFCCREYAEISKSFTTILGDKINIFIPKCLFKSTNWVNSVKLVILTPKWSVIFIIIFICIFMALKNHTTISTLQTHLLALIIEHFQRSSHIAPHKDKMFNVFSKYFKFWLTFYNSHSIFIKFSTN